MSGEQLTLVAPARPGRLRLPAGYSSRPVSPRDVADLGGLYFAAYDPGVACGSLEEAVTDTAATFAGEYGPLWQPGSLGAWRDRRLVAAVLTVCPAPWDDAPPGPFVVELFTDRRHRRRGLARSLLLAVLGAACSAEPPEVALRVAGDNEPAVALYRSLGFADREAPAP